jgi:flavin-dependent dehydrogenase
LIYDVVIIGAGISGSISALTLANNGYKVLLIDRKTPPRNKVCSGVQLSYMEKLIGKKIPKEILCSNILRKVRVETPDGRYIEGKMPLLNYWRKDFDYWLNSLALDSGAEAYWGSKVKCIRGNNGLVEVLINSQKIKTKYLIGSDGLSPYSFSRRWLFPENFSKKITGASINIYYKGSSSVSPDTLYLYFRKNLSNLMYSWVYYKDDLLVIGTSSSEKMIKYTDSFLKFVKNEFNLIGVEVKREGFSTHCKGGVLLGKGRILLVGDAAGLIDLYRGMGMDTAALSGRICAHSILDAFKGKGSALENYRSRSSKLVSFIKNNSKKQELRYASKKTLEDSLSTYNIIKTTFSIIGANFWNRFCKPEDIILIPPI